jgi:hypothetical protein
MRLTVALPDLLAQDRATLEAARALCSLADYADAPDVRRGSLDSFLLGEPSDPRAEALAPVAALGAGFDPGRRYVLRADPVSLAAGRADVVLAGRIDDLDASEAAALTATFNAHFEGDGIEFHAPRADAWFITMEGAPDLTTTPLSVVHGAIYPWLPSGAAAGRWRRWFAEMQMLLHEHPANAARAARGRVPVTGIWISDGGRLGEAMVDAGPAIFAAAGRTGDVARGVARLHGNVARDPPPEFAALHECDDAIVVLDQSSAANASHVDHRWLSPAVAALERGSLSTLTLLADGNGAAAAWRAQRPSWLRRAHARFASTPFTAPSAINDE